MSKKRILSNWSNFFEQRGIPEDIREIYLRYIKKLLVKDVPIIFDFNHLSKLVGRQQWYLASVVNNTSSHYRTFNLKKRSGGFREISVPYPALLGVQYWVYKNILQKIPINNSSHGFAKNKSIITNSKIHLGQSNLLKMDLKDFFPSIHLARVIKVFKALGYTTKVSYYLASVCCINDCLPQGAPTSPILSNIISFDLDRRLYLFAKKFNLKYSRYADDLTFSGENINVKMIHYISEIIVSEGFIVNDKKTRLHKESAKRIVTGISVAGSELKLPKKYKRDLKQELYYINKYGIHSHVSSVNIKHTNYIDVLIGKLNFWLSVEPGDEFVVEQLKMLYSIKYPESIPK
ncbi:RNA-directed DNA polymerase [Nibribacter ruber]|uniref:RNA-directed DNA polymerase n=1 Tax=Nibribacter ruber TaxID=2698458 RepID=A0A6P1NPY9_9BACT|nr:reverse transcriptase family protein [Nibribacter ruber]QHL85976.1 RNA-directed DNA polymerase [Nibribacter ruber]